MRIYFSPKKIVIRLSDIKTINKAKKIEMKIVKYKYFLKITKLNLDFKNVFKYKFRIGNPKFSKDFTILDAILKVEISDKENLVPTRIAGISTYKVAPAILTK